MRDSREAELVDDMMEVDEVTFAFRSSGALARAANLKASLPIFGFGAKIPFTLDIWEDCGRFGSRRDGSGLAE